MHKWRTDHNKMRGPFRPYQDIFGQTHLWEDEWVLCWPLSVFNLHFNFLLSLKHTHTPTHTHATHLLWCTRYNLHIVPHTYKL